jgi:hypothetical protein
MSKGKKEMKIEVNSHDEFSLGCSRSELVFRAARAELRRQRKPQKSRLDEGGAEHKKAIWNNLIFRATIVALLARNHFPIKSSLQLNAAAFARPQKESDASAGPPKSLARVSE